MNDSPEKNSKINKNANAGIAGAGSGTLLTVVATQLDDSNAIKPWLIYAIPTFSVIFGAIWVWMQVKFINFIRDKEAQKVSLKATKAIEEALSDPNTSDEHKVMLRGKLEQFQMQNINRSLKKLQNADVLSTSDLN